MKKKKQSLLSFYCNCLHSKRCSSNRSRLFWKKGCTKSWTLTVCVCLWKKASFKPDWNEYGLVDGINVVMGVKIPTMIVNFGSDVKTLCISSALRPTVLLTVFLSRFECIFMIFIILSNSFLCSFQAFAFDIRKKWTERVVWWKNYPVNIISSLLSSWI